MSMRPDGELAFGPPPGNIAGKRTTRRTEVRIDNGRVSKWRQAVFATVGTRRTLTRWPLDPGRFVIIVITAAD